MLPGLVNDSTLCVGHFLSDFFFSIYLFLFYFFNRQNIARWNGPISASFTSRKAPANEYGANLIQIQIFLKITRLFFYNIPFEFNSFPPPSTPIKLYHDDDPDCSELCRCGAGQVVTCSISDCAERIPCQTSAAVYAHAATAFQAYRGECLCFSGTLVCARPDPGIYN